jgi:hypothetical protein
MAIQEESELLAILHDLSSKTELGRRIIIDPPAGIRVSKHPECNTIHLNHYFGICNPGVPDIVLFRIINFLPTSCCRKMRQN